jgi:hypothetical protein
LNRRRHLPPQLGSPGGDHLGPGVQGHAS